MWLQYARHTIPSHHPQAMFSFSTSQQRMNSLCLGWHVALTFQTSEMNVLLVNLGSGEPAKSVL